MLTIAIIVHEYENSKIWRDLIFVLQESMVFTKSKNKIASKVCGKSIYCG